MKLCAIAKAEPVGVGVIDDLTIRVWGGQAEGDRGLIQHEEEAAELAEVLRAHLPGGTFDRLVARLLEMKACDFRVPRYVTDRDDYGNRFVPVVCRTCSDTHRMTLGDRQFMCTHCPIPCQHCRAGGNPYCATTPCACACHRRQGCSVIASVADVDPGRITCRACIDRPEPAARLTEQDVTRALRNLGSDDIPTDEWETRVLDKINREEESK